MKSYGIEKQHPGPSYRVRLPIQEMGMTNVWLLYTVAKPELLLASSKYETQTTLILQQSDKRKSETNTLGVG